MNAKPATCSAIALPLQSPPEPHGLAARIDNFAERRDAVSDAVDSVMMVYPDLLAEELTDAYLSSDYTQLAAFMDRRLGEFFEARARREDAEDAEARAAA